MRRGRALGLSCGSLDGLGGVAGCRPVFVCPCRCMLECLCCCAVCKLGVCVLLILRWVVAWKDLRTCVAVYFMRTFARVASVQRREVFGKWVAHGGRGSSAVSRRGFACSSSLIVLFGPPGCRLQVSRRGARQRGDGSVSFKLRFADVCACIRKLQLVSHALLEASLAITRIQHTASALLVHLCRHGSIAPSPLPH